jgi:hypothetical protein
MFRLREGEELSLDEIMDRWQGRLASYLFRLTGSETVALISPKKHLFASITIGKGIVRPELFQRGSLP